MVGRRRQYSSLLFPSPFGLLCCSSKFHSSLVGAPLRKEWNLGAPKKGHLFSSLSHTPTAWHTPRRAALRSV